MIQLAWWTYEIYRHRRRERVIQFWGRANFQQGDNQNFSSSHFGGCFYSSNDGYSHPGGYSRGLGALNGGNYDSAKFGNLQNAKGNCNHCRSLFTTR